MTAEKARIIVVEDEPLTRASIALALEKDGHHVRQASDVFACRAALKAAPADIVLLDLGLPGVDGLTFARELRASSDIGVIVVTVRDDIDQRIAALDEGADDYLIKPIHLGELAAHVRAVARRRLQSRGRRYRFAHWLADLDKRSVSDETGAAIMLTRGEFDLLCMLIEAGGKIVSRELLGGAINRQDGNDVRSVDALVSRLRRKLASPAHSGPIIVTAQGFGYRLGPEPIAE